MKTKNPNPLTLASITLLLFGATMAFGIPDAKAATTKSQGIDSTWTLDTTVSDVRFYHKIVSCNGQNVVLLRFDNQNEATAIVTWREEFKTQVGDNEPGFKGLKELTLAAGETDDLDCNSTNDILVNNYASVSPAYPAKITGFSFKEINVNIQ